ncbi:hypothetical protein ATANTOWER_003717 [Ataeniobius toweri]|uniref:Uncharacterized protein n=1 Tax=Ataeniobius toweri TaxID=208326 RepID=A0ABU7AY26_9TELE|nr:hypothetical protein [Ataeniobius toweri]
MRLREDEMGQGVKQVRKEKHQRLGSLIIYPNRRTKQDRTVPLTPPVWVKDALLLYLVNGSNKKLILYQTLGPFKGTTQHRTGPFMENTQPVLIRPDLDRKHSGPSQQDEGCYS